MNEGGAVLLIEDHRDIAELVYDYLERRGFSVDYAADGSRGLQLAFGNSYDAVVLDVMLPGADGLEVCRRIRSVQRTPVLMLTARDTLDDKLAGFDSGADDYLVKPFDLAELDARLRSLIRRARGGGQDVLQVDELVFDTRTRKVTRAGRELVLTPIGMKILKLLMQASPALVERRALERALWGDVPPDSDALRSHMYSLRKAVDRPFARALIHTVPSTGFRLAGDA
jgi:DNA-binding response OmpR family regulator